MPDYHAIPNADSTRTALPVQEAPTPSWSLGQLSRTEWERLQDAAEHFEEAWEQADSVDLADYLPLEADSLRRPVLKELIKTELEIRWRRGRGRKLEHYLERFPELGGAAELDPQLVFEEYRSRHVYGDRPPLEEYRRRFPAQFAELQQLVERRTSPRPRRRPAVPLPPREASRPAPAAPRSGDVLDIGEGYRLVRRLGSGGSGEVWLALAPGDVEVALKIVFRSLDQEAAQRERDALELMKQLRHPFLLAVQGSWVREDRLLIALELADGSLRDRLKECLRARLPGIPLPELLRSFREVAEALDYLHSENVQHRDIKPDNILLLKGHAKLADFGLASLVESASLASASISGTPAYMAPERWYGKISIRSDQYSLAVSYAEMRLKRQVFAGRGPTELMFDHVQRTPDLAALGPRERQVLHRALAKDPERRFATCTEFVEALDEAVKADLARPSAADEVLAEQPTVVAPVAAPPVPPPAASPPASAPSVASVPTAPQRKPARPPSQAWRPQLPRRRGQPLLAVLLALVLPAGGAVAWWTVPPLLARASHRQALAFAERGELDQALRALDRAAWLAPADPLVYKDRGNTLVKQGDFAQAIAAFDQALALDPSCAAAYNGRGAAHASQQEYAQALADYDEALRLDPGCAAAYYNRGVLHQAQGNLEQALADFSAAIRLDPGHPLAYNGRGLVFAALHRRNDALADFTQAIRLAENDPLPYHARADVFAALGDQENARADRARARALEAAATIR